jgi:type II restriction/modification system DNA methylase subunit YeeA
MQAVVRKDKRSKLGMHYTSVENIHKVIDPLFLNDLRDAIDMAKSASNPGKSLRKLLSRIREMKIFDPACGSGNFLIITYKELRKLEDEIHETLGQIPNSSGISLSNFYGVEVDPFAVQTAKLSLWIAYHQMNSISNDLLNSSIKSLPLKDSGNIVCANACRIDWEGVCPRKNDDEEIYIIGNPPYLGSRNQEAKHKEDIELVLSSIGNGYKKLDYIACWFFKAINMIVNYDARSAFVSTNSICQGEQVPILWKYIFENHDVCIHFAHQSFKWINSAKNNAGVTCVIIGISKKITKNKILFRNDYRQECQSISPYLLPANNIYFINKKTKNISNVLSEMIYGSEPRENGNLMISDNEYKKLLSDNPALQKYIKKAIGSNELLNKIQRYCIWIDAADLNEASSSDFIATRLNAVKKYRLTSSRQATIEFAAYPHKFTSRTYKKQKSLVVPIVFSEKRNYLVSDFCEENTIILNSAQVIYDPPVYIFGIISSRMHMTWVRTVAGRLKTDIRYSSELCYNTFPFPEINDKHKEAIENISYRILDARAEYPEKTLAELYDPDKMPANLLEAHKHLDEAIEKCYRERPFESDEERLEELFKLYEKMTKQLTAAN